ncbi:hypothetical protein WDU94_001717, partial [Cyamophila willieti]
TGCNIIDIIDSPKYPETKLDPVYSIKKVPKPLPLRVTGPESWGDKNLYFE